MELTIDSTQSDKEVMRELEAARVLQRQTMWDLAALDQIDDLFKPAGAPAEPRSDRGRRDPSAWWRRDPFLISASPT